MLFSGINLISMISLFSATALSAQTLPSDEPLRVATQSIIKTILVNHQKARTYQEWRESGKTPEDLLLPAIDATHPNMQAILCGEMETLGEEDLSLFYNILLEQGARVYCFTQLANKMEHYYERFQADLYFQYMDSLQKQQLLTPGKAPITQPLGPSEDLLTDTQGGPIFIRADLPDHYLSLTFDDGPHSSLTPQLLQILKAEKATATFFVLGRQTLSAPSTLESTQNAGHTIASHTVNHLDLSKQSATKAEKEISKSYDIILGVLDFMAPFFRFPYGAKTSRLAQYVKKSNVSAFYWNIDTLDWKIKNPQKLLQYALEQVEDNKSGIVLFHDIQPQTISMMPTFLRTLAVRRYKLVIFKPIKWITKNQRPFK